MYNFVLASRLYPIFVSKNVFYVYRPMSICKRHEVTLCIMEDVDGIELAL